VNQIYELFNLAKRKLSIKAHQEWSQGSKTFLEEIQKEVHEVAQEVGANRPCHLEDELADVLWDYVNLVLSLEEEESISFSSILDRAVKKYCARIEAMEAGISWSEIKGKQKLELEDEEIEFAKKIKE
jgi:NTP pyrophosphatase (non-canonical NTP hydrolase)